MARATISTLIMMAFVLAVFLNISALTVAVDATCMTAGQGCGGFAGAECCEGLECELEEYSTYGACVQSPDKPSY
ncbi:hypothetical protein BVRB_4g091360 [Beta vulgaris subsp. vulgaris]|nr:hypothetical protein BVRB_4g091360 [Beta vulgaris subsp. vulgaris]